ncbi:2-phospho-L-lactate guanylyltransferase [Nocardioides sp. CPCC 205120]|uniref:2-phospho-L-lactate guanylyltransferase n=1 Tax=Nocardioides sp. CPCC 205120 TaxID=3406462 RepID=UPI003B50C375
MSTSPSAAILLPVKPPAVGKSRLGEGRAPRSELAAAFALDTARAALATPGVVGVLVLTDDHVFADHLARLGCTVVPDPVDGDLNGTLRQGAREAARRWPDALPVALCADLPALRPADLADALARVLDADGPVFVSDAAGTGTTLYGAPLPLFDPRYGPGSTRAHLAAGAVPIEGALPTLRHDVDDAAALDGAVDLGLGPWTAGLLARHPG